MYLVWEIIWYFEMQFTITSTVGIYAHPSYSYSTRFLVFEFSTVIFLHNCVHHGLRFRHGLIFIVSILRICEFKKLKSLHKHFYVISIRTSLTCYFNVCLLNLYIGALEISQCMYVVSDGFIILNFMPMWTENSLVLGKVLFCLFCLFDFFYHSSLWLNPVIKILFLMGPLTFIL